LTMLRAWRNELICVALGGLALWFVGTLTGIGYILLGAGCIAYLGWHIFNLVRLQRWIVAEHRSRLPVSAGLWEAVFDGLQRHQLDARQRTRSLVRTLSDTRSAASRLPDALVALDAENRILWFNNAARRLLGLCTPEDIGGNLAELVNHPLLEDGLAESDVSRSVEIPSPANGAWMLSAHLTETFGQDGGRMLVAWDITAHHQIDQVRRDFVTNVSHELRTPITVFRGFLEPLRAMAPSADFIRPLTLMDEQARRMELLVNDLLTLSRLEMGGRPLSRAPVPIAAMLAEIVDQAESLSGEHRHRLILNTDPALSLRGDRQELYSAFSNLVFNAVRHTWDGTVIDVAWEAAPDGPCLTVRDYGGGIPAQHLPRLTERFYRVDQARSRGSGGTGLGLAIAKHVLERHGGDLKITSQLGRGSTFACQFPEALAVRDDSYPGYERQARRA